MNDFEVSSYIWSGSYIVYSTICIIIGGLYTLLIYRDIMSLTPKLPGYKLSQMFFLAGIFSRGIGWLIQAILYLYQTNVILEIISPITIGLPGYILAISYVLFFYLWSSIYLNLISNDSKGYRKEFKATFNISLLIMLVFGSSIIGVTVYQLFKKTDNHLIHYIEGFIAITRDFFIATIIFIKSLAMINMSEEPLCSSNFNESIYCLMLLCISLSLYIRSYSILIYILVLFNNNLGGVTDYFNTFFSAAFSEFFPCFVIFITRKKSGLLSVYDLID